MVKKSFLIVLFSVISFNCYAQIVFEKGYFVKNSGERVNGLIRNVDWRSNPTKFEYKLTKNSESKTITLKSVQEFGILNKSKYKRFIVKIDRSSKDIGELSVQRRAEFNEEQLFLKVLVEGNATLYSYQDGSLKRFFYQINDGRAVQLVFKKFLTANGKVGENVFFKQQLLNNFNCQRRSIDYFEDISYEEQDLVEHFIKFNRCTNSEVTNFVKKKKRDLFNLVIRPGLQTSSLSTHDSVSNLRETDFGNEVGFRIGIEAEFILPYYKNTWAVILEPSYQYFKSEKRLDNGQSVSIDYKSVELLVGIRHYFFLEKDSKTIYRCRSRY